MVYDQNGGKNATTTASALVKAGYNNIVILTGGFEDWKAANYDVASGKLAEKAVYAPKPRPGEIKLDEFKKYVAELPSDVVIIDARTAAEGSAGMLKNAKLIPAEELKDRLAEIPKDKLIVFYCNNGLIAEVAYNTLKGLGYTNVKFVNAKVKFEKNGKYTITKD